MDNLVVLSNSDSDSDYSNDTENSSQREEVIYENDFFMNHTNKDDYMKNRNSIFTKDIEKIDE